MTPAPATPRLLFCLGLAVLLQMADVVLTYHFVVKLGQTEGNPFARWLIANIGWGLLCVAKCSLPMWCFENCRTRFAQGRFLRTHNWIMGVVVLWNILNIIFVGNIQR